MLRAKNRTAIVNAAYNRYAWNDPLLPEWFANEEARFNKGQLPVTKAQVEEYKQSLKAIDARPIKKIAEARARKKMKTVKKWEKIKVAANNIANSEAAPGYSHTTHTLFIIHSLPSFISLC
jgi:AdoMet-dependent rRNA methyltransferase SPB1